MLRTVSLLLITWCGLLGVVRSQTECATLSTLKCAKQPCKDPSRECPRGRCVPCGCSALCIASVSQEQYPLVRCPDGSAALQCKVPANEIGCSNVRCAGVQCKEYMCGGKCMPICVGGGTDSIADSSSSSNSGAALLKTTIPLHPTTPVAKTTNTQPNITAIKVTGSRSMLQSVDSASDAALSVQEIMCPGRKPAQLCNATDSDVPPRITCKNVKCRTGSCRMFTCGGKCFPKCVEDVSKDECPPGVPLVQCLINPCAFTLCLPNTTCKVNRCGNCTAECKPNADTGGDGGIGENGSICLGNTTANCFVDPCMTKNCSEGTYCQAEYCGGCNAACLPVSPRCPTGKPRRPCMGTANKCLLAKFSGGRTCVPDQCNDCAARGIGPCPPGQYVNAARLKCMPCAPGYACAGGNSTSITAEPEPCNGGFYANGRGSVECKKCRDGTTTPDGPEGAGYTRCQPARG